MHQIARCSVRESGMDRIEWNDDVVPGRCGRCLRGTWYLIPLGLGGGVALGAGLSLYVWYETRGQRAEGIGQRAEARMVP